MNLPPFDRVVSDHGADLHRYLVAGVGPDRADDCLQEVLLAALRAYPSLDDPTGLRPWLFTIAYHKAIDSHRAESRRQRVHRAVTDSAGRAGAGSAPAHELADADLWQAVRKLPAKQRAAVLHRFLHDLPYRDIAVIIGCSEAAARQNVRAGLATLRKEYRP